MQGLIFDMDGTLVDNMGVHTAVWLELLAEFGVEMTALEFQAATGGNTNIELLRKLVNPAMSEAEANAIGLKKEILYRERYQPDLRPVAGLMPFLRQAQQVGLKTAVATAAGQENIDFVLGGLSLRPYFAAVVGADDVARGKPFPDLFLAAADRLDLPPEACLVFEDSLAGLEAARRAGMAAIALTTSHPPEELSRLPGVRQTMPDYTQLNLADLLGIKI